MQRIKGIVKILQRFAVATLFAAVQPDGNERQKGKTLPGDEMCRAENLNLVGKSREHFHIDIPQAKQLRKEAPPSSAPKEIEHKYRENAGVIKVHEGNDPAHIADADRGDHHQNALPKGFVLCPFIPVDQPDGDEKTPENILVDRIKEAAAHGKVEGDLRNQGKDKKPEHIFFQIFRVEISFHKHESKNREGESANAEVGRAHV